MSVLHDVRDYVGRNFLPDVDPAEIDPDLDLLDTGVIDSLSLLRVIAWLGERYDIPIDEIDITPDYFRTLAAIDGFVAEFAPGPAALSLNENV